MGHLLHRVKLRTLLVLPFVLQIVSTVGLVGYLSFRSGQQSVNQLANQLMSQVSQRVDQHLDNYLTLPHQINQINIDAIQSGRLSLRDFEKDGHYFWEQLQIFPNFNYSAYILKTGEFVGAGRWIAGKGVTVEELSAKNQWQDYTYQMDDQGKRQKLIDVSSYKPLEEPVYKDTLKSGKPNWSRPYNWGDVPQYISIAATYPIYNQKSQFIGIIGLDLLLTNISDFLRGLAVSPSGKVVLLEHDGLLIASSSAENPFLLINGRAERLNIVNSQDPLIRATAHYLLQKFGNFQKIKENQQFDFKLDGKRQMVHVSNWTDEYGLDWLVVVVIPEADFMRQIQANTRLTFLLCLAALLLSIAISMLIARWVTHPIVHLNRAAKEITAGNFHQMIKVAPTEELEELSASFTFMATQLETSFSALAESQQQLALQNQTLEEQVQKRSQELLQAQEEILQVTQQKLIEAEKMASLGQLIAGVAHEINNPLGAIQASISNISYNLKQSQHELPQLFEKLPPERLTDFFMFLEQVEQQAELLSSRQERQLRRTLKQILDECGIENTERLADTLSKMGMSGDLAPFMPLFKDANHQLIVQSAYHLSSIRHSSQNIEIAVERAAKVVTALKNYARQAAPENKIKASIPDGIDTVLTIYHNQLKRGIEVSKSYKTVSSIFCYPEELMQAWSNLIHNAIQAMNEQGQLQIRVFEAEQHIIVEFEDTGCGISLELHQRIFEPFFTTKVVGQGTGLGLSIVRKIIDKHQGQIEIDSQPGHNIFRVMLPVDQREI